MGLYFKYFSMHLKSQMQHKASFFMTILGQFLVSFTTFLGIYFMMSRFNEVQGFTMGQTLICFAATLAAFSLAEMLGRGFDLFAQMLGNGEFDRALVRPHGVVFQVLLSKMDFTRIGRLVQSALVLCYAVPNCGVQWNALKVLTLILMIAGGAIIFFSLFVVGAAFAFFTTEGLEFMNILTDGGREFGKYPYSVYGRGVLRFVTLVVPLALFQYYPLLYLLDIKSGIQYMLMPLIGVWFVVPAYLFFLLGIKKYKSTGS